MNKQIYEKFKDKIIIIPHFFRKNISSLPCYRHFRNYWISHFVSRYYITDFKIAPNNANIDIDEKLRKKTAWNIPHHRSIWISLSILQCSFNVCSNIEIENKNLRIEFFPLCSTLFFSFFCKIRWKMVSMTWASRTNHPMSIPDLLQTAEVTAVF